MNKSTAELLDTLKKSPSLTKYTAAASENFIENRLLSSSLKALLKEKHLKQSDIINRSNLDYRYACDIFSGRTRKPARNKVLALCLSMQLSIDETQKLLNTTEYPQLYAKVEREAIILYALQNHWSVMDTNIYLENKGYAPLV